MNKYQKRINTIRNRLPELNKNQLKKLAEDENYIKFVNATIVANIVLARIVKRDILKEGETNENKHIFET